MPAAGVQAVLLLAQRGVPEGDDSIGCQGFIFNFLILGFSFSVGPGGGLLTEAWVD